MNSAMGAPLAPGDPDFPTQLHSLRTRLQQLRPGGGPGHPRGQTEDGPELRQGLETAYEELRVADEEVRAQQEEIARLLETHQQLHRQHERMLAVLPVPAVVTDTAGIIRTANAAAAALASVPATRMVGRPVFSMLDPSDRREFRQFLLDPGRRALRRTATVVPRQGPARQVVVSATALAPGSDVSWVLLPALPTAAPPRHEAVLEALARLVGVAGRGSTPAEVLRRAAPILRDGLGGGCELSISLGDPSDPGAVASTSQLAQHLDGAQLAAGEGPSLDAFTTGAGVVTAAADADARWPRLALRWPAPGSGALAVPVTVGERPVGCLTVYAAGHLLGPDAREAVELLAVVLGAAVHELELGDEVRRLEDDLKRATASRAVIEQAKGIVMVERRCTADEAFAHLARLSNLEERKLRDVARTIVDRIGSARAT